MEFKEFLKFISKRKKKLLGWWLSLIVIGFLIVIVLPNKLQATLSIDIARNQQNEKSGEYQYDQFYRLEADGRFANTLVQWSKDPNVQRVIADQIGEKLNDEQISIAMQSMRAEKKSANLVQVSFDVMDQKDAAPFAKSTYDVFVQKTNSLNLGADQEGWFKIIGSGPTVSEKSIPLTLLFLIFASGSLLISLLIVLAGHYFKEEEKQNEDRI